jgi:hypothetical protein
MIIVATVVVTVGSHRRKSNTLTSVKRRLSFSNLPTTDLNGSASDSESVQLVHERTHVSSASV